MTTFLCRVILLDDTVIERDLEKKAVGQVLFDQACEYLNLLERHYFGLAAWDSCNNKVWLDFSKQVHKQKISHDATFTFSVKFYPPDPSVLAEDITRYLLCLQLRTDILTSRLPCPSDVVAVLGSYMIQSEFGDYNPELHGKEFYSEIPFTPNQTPELEEAVAELHRKLKSTSPVQADQLFLQNVKTLDMYGVHLRPAKDASGGDVMLGVCADGLVVYEDEEKTQSFIWPSVVKMSYRHSSFHARISQSEDPNEDVSEYTIKFILPNYRACKCMWRYAAEHHAFFSEPRNLDKAPERLLHLGSRFRFHGLTHAESLEDSATIKRPAPRFSRSALKRKAKASLLVALKRPNRTECDDWFQVLGSDESWPTYGPVSLQPSQAEEQKEQLEWIEEISGKSITVVTEQHEELEMERNVMRLDIVGENLELDFGSSEKILRVTREKLEREGDGEEIQTVVMYEQRTQEVETSTGQSQEAFVEERMRGMEVVETVHELMLKTSQNVFEEDIEDVEERLLEVESIRQRLHDIEKMKVRLQEVETLEQKLQEVQQAGRRRGENNDWYILLEYKLMESPAPKRVSGVETSDLKLQDIEHKRQQPGERGDWYLLLGHKPLVTSSLSAVDTVEQKAEIRQWIQEERQRANTLTPVQMKEDWYILLESIPRYTQTMHPAPPPAAEPDIQSSWVHVVEEHKHLGEEKEWPEERAVHMRETQPTLPAQREQIQKQVDEDWFIHFDASPKKTVPMTLISEDKVTIKEKDVTIDKKPIIIKEKHRTVRGIPATMREDEDNWFVLFTQAQIEKKIIATAGLRRQQTVTIKEKEITIDKKPMIMKEKQVTVRGVEKKIPTTMREDEDNWFVLFTPAQIEKKVIATAGVSDTWIQEEKRLKEVQKGQLREDVKRSHVVEDRRFHPYVSGPKAEEHHRVHHLIDDWFVLLEPVSKKSVSVDRRAEEDRRRREEVFKKQGLAEDRRKVAGFKPPSVPVVPSDQPMTSTPTAQYVRITRPAYQEESLKRLDITQITQDIKQESKVETESIITRKRTEKRVEGGSIYIRHSILMLEDSDVTQEVVLRHHASISELKRHFMGDMPVYGPTEWDRRLSAYTPVVFPQLSNGELLILA